LVCRIGEDYAKLFAGDERVRQPSILVDRRAGVRGVREDVLRPVGCDFYDAGGAVRTGLEEEGPAELALCGVSMGRRRCGDAGAILIVILTSALGEVRCRLPSVTALAVSSLFHSPYGATVLITIVLITC
jgi:hypothetical protein